MYKLIEAFTNVFYGRFQQKDRIDLSGKTFFFRVVFSTIMFIAIILMLYIINRRKSNEKYNNVLIN